MNYKLSFIVPIYNRAKLLPRCLDSVLNANRDDVEIIMVDDASTDDSVEVAKSYVDRYSNVKLIECKENGGPGVARNIGMDNAKGDFLFFLDSDDMIVTENIGKLVDALDDSIDVIMFNTRTQSFGREHYSQTPSVDRAAILDSDDFFDIYYNDFSSVLWNHCFNRLFIKRNGFSFAPAYYHEDLCFLVQALINTKTFGLLPKLLYCHVCGAINSIANTMHCNSALGNELAYNSVSATLTMETGSKRKWLLNIQERLLWASLKWKKEEFPQKLAAELELLALRISEISKPIWFMPVTSYNLFQELLRIKNFTLGGFLDNVLDDKNRNVKELRDQGYTVSLPDEIKNTPNAIVVFFVNSAIHEAVMKQLFELGFHLLLYESGSGVPKLLVNF